MRYIRHRPRPRLAALALLLALGGTLACTSAARRGGRGFEQKGVASWYGPGFDGKRTANGEVYDMDALTAAHKELAFGSVVEVKNLDNGRTVKVRINDRGPFVRGRIIDLSRAAAREVGMIGPGTARVRIRVVGQQERVRGTTYLVQVGAFRDPQRARELSRRLEGDYPRIRVRGDGEWHRVEIGPFAKRKEAESVVRSLARGGHAAVLRKA